MDKIIKELGIDEELNKIAKKSKNFNSVKKNIPHKEDYNFMADLIMLPKTKKGFRYLLTVVDLWTDEFDAEPLKTKEPKDILAGMKKIFKRKWLNKPYASIATDAGSEFKGVFQNYLYNNSIYHKVASPNRHTQQANIESLNKQINRILVGYMNKKTEELGKDYNEWTDILSYIRNKLNEYRTQRQKKMDKKGLYNPEPIKDISSKFKLGDVVRYALDTPRNALGKQVKPPFRVGDYRWSKESRKIKQLLYFSDKPHVRYILEGIRDKSFSPNQLKKSNDKENTFLVDKIINKKTINGRVNYLVKWKGYNKKDSTWEPRKKLIEDGLKQDIDEYEKSKK